MLISLIKSETTSEEVFRAFKQRVALEPEQVPESKISMCRDDTDTLYMIVLVSLRVLQRFFPQLFTWCMPTLPLNDICTCE